MLYCLNSLQRPYTTNQMEYDTMIYLAIIGTESYFPLHQAVVVLCIDKKWPFCWQTLFYASGRFQPDIDKINGTTCSKSLAEFKYLYKHPLQLLRYLTNLELCSVRVKELFEPIVLRKKKANGFCFF